MYRILEARKLADNIYEMVVEAPRVAKRCLPGQFVIVKADEAGERIPLTICDYDRQAGTITIVFMPIGVSTFKLAALGAGDCFHDFVGPLGQPSELCLEDNLEETRKKRILFVAGGVGTAPVYPQVKWLCEHGIRADAIIGAKTKNLVILEDKFREVCNLYVTTDDGSYGRQGNVTVPLDEMLSAGEKFDMIITIGPLIMMKFVTLTAKKYDAPITVSMSPIMIDGTGMCGGCRLTVHTEEGDKMKFACVDGPDFNGYEVDFDEAISRGRMYFEYERHAHEATCNLFRQAENA